MNRATKWVYRVIYFILFAAVLICGVILAFAGSYDGSIYKSQQEEVFKDSGSDLGDTITRLASGVSDQNSVIGVQATVSNKDVVPAFVDQVRTRTVFVSRHQPFLCCVSFSFFLASCLQSGNAISSTVSAKTGSVSWYKISLQEGQTLNVTLILNSPGAFVPWLIRVLTTKESMTAAPRAAGVILLVLFLVLIVIFEVAIYRFEKKYKAAEAPQRKDMDRLFK